MAFIEHAMIKKDTLESRLYQEAILGRAVGNDLLCVLPTGLGKTPIAIVLTVFRLQKFPGSKVLVMAPTRPLTEQHLHSFKRVIELPEQAGCLQKRKHNFRHASDDRERHPGRKNQPGGILAPRFRRGAPFDRRLRLPVHSESVRWSGEEQKDTRPDRVARRDESEDKGDNGQPRHTRRGNTHRERR